MLASGTFLGLEKLWSLYLSNNNITFIEAGAFDGLKNLWWLILVNAGIHRIERNTFHGLDTLFYLDLSYNPITVVEPHAFANLSRLEYLLLAGAKLRIVDGNTVSPLKSLKALSTSDTRLCCLLQDHTNTTCTSTVPSNPLDTCGSLFPSGVLRVFGWLMGLSALIGNCLVLYFRLYHEQDSKVQNQLIANLAVADCVMAVYMIVITSADLHFGSKYFLAAPLWRDSVMCKFAGSLAFLSSEASVISLSLITLDRFTYIVFPFGSWRITHRMCRIILSITWIIVLVISIPSMIDSSKIPDFYGQSDVCIGLPLHLTSGETGVLVTTKESEWSRDYTVTFLPLDNAKRPPWLYSIVVFIGINLLSFIFIVVCYVVMFVKVSRSSKVKTNSASRSREIKVARRMAILIGTDFACWMPIILMGILSQTGTVEIPITLYAWSAIFILPINSSLNPMLYTFMYYLDKGKKHRKTGGHSYGLQTTYTHQ
ncbi:G-protein coupled receptor GRL101-like [Diadema antillarum]|uniref:G-protein coupled receptor GRL101-like n=1 Tax=Diadema antillarum TaxID=105358 RepID=UPI003A84A848